MKNLKYILVFFISVFSTFSFGQIKFEEATFVNSDTIKELVVGDTDDNKFRDIFFTTNKSDFIFQLLNDGEKFVKKTYLPIKGVEKINVANLNNPGDDFMCSTIDSSNLRTFYGKDNYNPEKKGGPFIGKNTLDKIESISTIEVDLNSNPPKFLNLHLINRSNNLVIWGTLSSSFDLIADSKVTEKTYNFNIEKVLAYHSSETNSTIILFDDKGNMYKEVLVWKDPYSVKFENEALPPTIDVAPGSINDALLYTYLNKTYILYISKNSPDITKFNLSESKKEIITTNLIKPAIIAVGTIDLDSIPDILLVEENKIYMNSGFNRSSGFELLAENDKDIKKIITNDFNKDGKSDLLFLEKASGDIIYLVNKTESVSVVDKNEEFLIFNSLISENVKFYDEVLLLSITNVKGMQIAINQKVNNYDLSKYSPGLYFINYFYKGEKKSNKLIKL